MAFNTTARVFPLVPQRRGGSGLGGFVHDGRLGRQVALDGTRSALAATIATD
jgi:hypothetical protein